MVGMIASGSLGVPAARLHRLGVPAARLHRLGAAASRGAGRQAGPRGATSGPTPATSASLATRYGPAAARSRRQAGARAGKPARAARQKGCGCEGKQPCAGEPARAARQKGCADGIGGTGNVVAPTELGMWFNGNTVYTHDGPNNAGDVVVANPRQIRSIASPRKRRTKTTRPWSGTAPRACSTQWTIISSGLTGKTPTR